MAYTYDQLGNRLTKTARDGSGVITKLTEYAYDVTAPDENFPTHNNRLLKYLEYVPDEGPALGGTPAFVHTRAYTAGSGTEIDEAGGGRLQRHSDLIGSTVCTSDDSGAAQPPSNRPVYTAFGELVAGSPGSRYGYAGDHGYEGAAGPAPGGAVVLPGAPGAGPIILLHVGARHYDPAIGRFIQRDPIGIEGGLNPYRYCSNRPTICIDPDGLNGTAWDGFWEGLHDGWIQTSYSTIDTLTFGAFNLDDLPGRNGWLFDSDNPGLGGCRIAGRVSGIALLCAGAAAASPFKVKGGYHNHTGGPHNHPHFQINWWTKGVKGSGGVWRIPLDWMS